MNDGSSRNLVPTSHEQQRNFEVRQRFFKLILDIVDKEVTTSDGRTVPLLKFASSNLPQSVLKKHPEAAEPYVNFRLNLLHNLRVITGQIEAEQVHIDTTMLDAPRNLISLNMNVIGKQTGINIFIDNKGNEPLSISIGRQYGPEGDRSGFPAGVDSYKIFLDGTVHAQMTGGRIREIDDTDAAILANAFARVGGRVNEIAK